ncbi:hypothetical protein Tco_0016010, partial [Tanacetum coccineum]
ESARDVYSKRRIIVVTKLQIVEWHNYKHLDWITVRKLTNLTIEEFLDFNVSLRMFTRSVVIQRRVEDLQLGVKSYQKKVNLTKPDTYISDLKRKETYSAYSNPKGFIYQNKDKKNRLMRIDELYNFSDGTLNDVWIALNDRLKGIPMKFDTLAGNPVKEILLKLNLLDHRILKDGGEEEHSEEETIEVMMETMEQYMSKTRGNYGSGFARPKINDKTHFDLKDKFSKNLAKKLLAFGAPYQFGGQYRAAGPGFYQRNNGNSSYLDQRQTLEELLTKFMAESAKRYEENSNIIKKIRAYTDAAIRNQGALIRP